VGGVSTKLPAAPPVYLEDLPAFVAYQVGRLDEYEYFVELGEEIGTTPRDALRAHNGILVEPFPGTLELVRDLQEAGVATGILSNTNAPHWQSLLDPDHYPAISLTNHKMASHLVGLEKPDAAIFRHWEKTFGYGPDQILFFDDNARNIAAALSCGWHATQIDPLADPAAQMRRILVTERVLPTPAAR
jgi:HAD superfamily hydrolase (TIGR01509 family)